MKLYKNNEWFISPRFDTLFLVNIPILLLFPFIWLHLKSPLLPPDLLSAIINWTQNLILFHFIATAGVVYLDTNEIDNKTAFFFIPALIISALLFMRLSLGLIKQTSTMLYYAVVVHEFVQYYYILRIFQLTKKQYPAIDAWISCAALLLGPLYPSLYNNNASDLSYYGPVQAIPIPEPILEVFRFLAIAALTIFTLRQIYIFKKTGRIYWFPILMVLTSNCLFYIPLIILKSNEIFMVVSFKLHHAFQYLAWLPLYCQLKYKGEVKKGAKILSYISHPSRTFLFILFFCALAFFLIAPIRMFGAFIHKYNATMDIFFMVALMLHGCLDIVFFANVRKISSAIIQ